MTFTELAVLVTDIHVNYYKIPKDFSGIIPVVEENNEIKTYYNYVLDAVKYKGINNVNLNKLDYEEKFILGRYQKYKDYADIWVATRQSACWRRYLAVKELSHLIVDSKESSLTLDIHSSILWMVHDGMKKGVNDALDSEHIAAQFAIEILLPYHATQSLLKNGSVDSSKIANLFKVPLYIVESIRKVSSNYLSNRDEAYLDTDIEHEVIVPN